jgi:hypothetical protein
MRFYFIAIHITAERFDPLLIDAKHALKELQVPAIKDDPYVEELLPFHPGHKAYHSIFK